MKTKQENELEQAQPETIQKEAWQTPEVEVLPIPDLTKGSGTDWIEGGTYTRS